jgi:hypothetical protein
MFRQTISGNPLLDFNFFPPFDQCPYDCGFIHLADGCPVRSSMAMGGDGESNHRSMRRSTHSHVTLLFPREESTPLCSQKVGCILK